MRLWSGCVSANNPTTNIRRCRLHLNQIPDHLVLPEFSHIVAMLVKGLLPLSYSLRIAVYHVCVELGVYPVLGEDSEYA